MQFRDLKMQYDSIKEKMDKAIFEVIEKGNFISGIQVQELEEKLAEFVGVKHCITCANGTDALSLALMTWGIGSGDAVFVPDFTFFSSGEVVSFAGATPVFVDVEKDTFNISPQSLEKAIHKVAKDKKLTPRVIVAVDLFGQPANYPAIKKIAEKNNLLILEDGAQGFGGKIGDKRACSFGDISTTSFFPAKPLGCYGDGGAVFTNSDEWAELLRSLRIHGKGSNKYDNVRIGMNSRLDTLQAAVLQAKLSQFENYELESINRVADNYTRVLKDVVITPTIKEGFYSSWAQYSILLETEEKRNGLQDYLKKQDIPSMIYYPKPMHMQQAFERNAVVGDECLNTIDLCKRVLALPLHPYMNEEMVRTITSVIKQYLK